MTDLSKLNRANQNPWYVLMTLHGEQGDEFDQALHQENRQAWNGWGGNVLSVSERASVAGRLQIDANELDKSLVWRQEIVERHAVAMKERNGDDFFVPQIPDPNVTPDFTNVRFANHVKAAKLYFPRGADFSGSVFEKTVVFDRLIFERSAKFSKAAFVDDVFFANVSFSANARFDGVNFCADIMILDSTFSDFSHFFGANFGSLKRDSLAVFNNCLFLKPTNFRVATFHNDFPDFAGSVLHEKTSFSADPEFWPKVVRDPKSAKETCAIIRSTVAKQGLPEDEHFFFRKEMGFAAQIGTPLERLPYLLFQWFSGFGYSIARPAWWLAGVRAVGAVAFWGYLLQTGRAGALGTALALSFSNMFQIFGFGRLYFDAGFMEGLPKVLQVYSGFQTVVALPLLFLLGLGMRTRFRLR